MLAVPGGASLVEEVGLEGGGQWQRVDLTQAPLPRARRTERRQRSMSGKGSAADTRRERTPVRTAPGGLRANTNNSSNSITY